MLASGAPAALKALTSAIDILLVSTLAVNGWLMAPLPPAILAAVFAAAVVLAFVLDGAKSVLFRALRIA